jgi:flavodoxin
MKKLLIVFHSMTSGTFQMAQAAASGAQSEPDVAVNLIRIKMVQQIFRQASI